MGNIRREWTGCEGGEPPPAELSGHDQQMGGQGERKERDSWGDGRDKAEIGGGMQKRCVESGQNVKKKKKKEEAENGRAEMWRDKGARREDADRGEDDEVFKYAG